MIKLGNLTYQKLKEKFRIKSPWDLIIIFVLKSVLQDIDTFEADDLARYSMLKAI